MLGAAFPLNTNEKENQRGKIAASLHPIITSLPLRRPWWRRDFQHDDDDDYRSASSPRAHLFHKKNNNCALFKTSYVNTSTSMNSSSSDLGAKPVGLSNWRHVSSSDSVAS